MLIYADLSDLVLFVNLEKTTGGDTTILKTTHALLFFYRREVHLEQECLHLAERKPWELKGKVIMSVGRRLKLWPVPWWGTAGESNFDNHTASRNQTESCSVLQSLLGQTMCEDQTSTAYTVEKLWSWEQLILAVLLAFKYTLGQLWRKINAKLCVDSLTVGIRVNDSLSWKL